MSLYDEKSHFYSNFCNNVVMNKRQFLATTASTLALGMANAVLPPQILAQPATRGLYAAWDNAIYYINHRTGAYRKITDNSWVNVTGMSAVKDKLYVICNQYFYELNPTNGEYRKLSNDLWYETYDLVTIGNELYAVFLSLVYRVKTSDGSYTKLEGGIPNLGDVTCLTTTNGKLYALRGAWLYSIDTKTGEYKQLGSGQLERHQVRMFNRAWQHVVCRA
jgi:hypothetical protein